MAASEEERELVLASGPETAEARWAPPQRIVTALLLGFAALAGVAAVQRRTHEEAPHVNRAKVDSSIRMEESWRTRKGSFLVIGDWGWDPQVPGMGGNLGSTSCQKAVADSMDARMQLLGDVKFIINVGDSFYPHGVRSKSDPQWDTKWRQVYSERLRSVPWYSVYGNHDYWQDPCACGDSPHDCAQVNSNTSDRQFFHMPNYTYFHAWPTLGLEIVALDLNRFARAWNKKEQPNAYDCRCTPCEAKCRGSLNARTDESFRLFHERMANSKAKNLLVFSHYPTDYFWAAPDFLNGLRDSSRHHIEYFGGHRHNVDQSTTVPILPNNNWLSGGGGGFSCDGRQQGFVVGEINGDLTIKTYPAFVDYAACCGAGVVP